MSRASARSNAVLYAVEQAAGLYRVPCYRMQSRVFDVVGAKGRIRPMLVGAWIDALGVRHTSGMADLLLTPMLRVVPLWPRTTGEAIRVAVPLWVECKAGAGRQNESQVEFQGYVQSQGGFYLLAGDCADVVLEWFVDHGVER
jgi:hypothetical protein